MDSSYLYLNSVPVRPPAIWLWLWALPAVSWLLSSCGLVAFYRLLPTSDCILRSWSSPISQLNLCSVSMTPEVIYSVSWTFGLLQVPCLCYLPTHLVLVLCYHHLVYCVPVNVRRGSFGLLLGPLHTWDKRNQAPVSSLADSDAFSVLHTCRLEWDWEIIVLGAVKILLRTQMGNYRRRTAQSLVH